jgi:hypothetical protein
MAESLKNQCDFNDIQEREFFDFLCDTDFDSQLSEITTSSTSSDGFANDKFAETRSNGKRKSVTGIDEQSEFILQRKSSSTKIMRKKKTINSGSLLAQFGEAGFSQLSRRAKATKLFVFPSFDKCDALLYFPSTMSRYLNSGDLDRLGVLFDTHLDKKCHVIAPCAIEVDVQLYLKFFELKNMWQTDFISCVHNTKVVENEMIATVYFKFTDNQFIYNSVAGSVKEEAFKPAFCVDKLRSERFEAVMDPTYVTEEERDRVRSVLNSDVDVEVYGTMVFKLKIDNTRNKIVQFTCELSPNKLVLSSDPSVLIYSDSKNPALYP